MSPFDKSDKQTDPDDVGGPVNKPDVLTEAKPKPLQHTAESSHNYATGPGSPNGNLPKETSTQSEDDPKPGQLNADEDQKVLGDHSRNNQDGQDDNDNISDGESVNETVEYWRLRDLEVERKKFDNSTSDNEDIDDNMKALRTKHQNLEERIKLAPKRMKQYNHYTRILEERIRLLEERCVAFDRKIQKASGIFVPPDLSHASPPAISTLNPDLGFKFWQEFMGKAPRANIIDVLVGEPAVPKSEMFRRKKASTSISNHGGHETLTLEEEERDVEYMDPSEDRNLDQEIARLKGTQLPERIRFNISSIPRLFWNACIGDLWDDIMLRPFKPLLLKAEEIQGIMSSMQKAIVSVISERAVLRQNESRSNLNEKEHDPKEDNLDINGSKSFEESQTITKNEWETIVRDFNLFHCELCVKAIALEWPNKAAFDRSFDSIRTLLNDVLLPVHMKFREYRAQKIHFHDLWHLFQTGDLIVDKLNTQKAGSSIFSVQCRRVLLTSGGRRVINPSFPPPILSTTGSLTRSSEDQLAPINGINVFAIYAYYLDFNGSVWRPVRERFVVHPFTGEREITDLEVYPVNYVHGAEEKLQDRGKRLHDLVTAKTVPYVDCTGIDLVTKEDINDKVIVDMKSYFISTASYPPPFHPPGALNVSETSDCFLGTNCTPNGVGQAACPHRKEQIHTDQLSDWEAYQDYVSGKLEFNFVPYDIKLWVSDFAICHYRLYTYKLQSRDWVQVEVQSLKTPKERDMSHGFNLLVLPEDHKHILESQVREHFRKRGQQGQGGGEGDDLDLVRGKGQGLIILLHGAPGVGKTCTAECIAELMKKPLYPITCGDLGSTAQEVETNLRKHFTLASKWDCVMLLDEADVFLARRKSADLDRNSIVSVFLRMLEYYKGLLFLTTNRVGAFDEAFKSRVHISLFYPNFDKKTTIKVWKTFIKQAKKKLESEGRKNVTVNSGEIKEFARSHWEENPKARWNGRQIRNAFHTAVAMAEFQARENEIGEGYDANKDVKITIGREQFEKIAKTAKEFDDYMNETTGATGDSKAAKLGMRKREKEAEKKKEREDAKAKEKKSKTEKKKDDSTDNSDSSEEDVKAKSAAKKGKRKKKSESDSDDSDSDSESDGYKKTR